MAPGSEMKLIDIEPGASPFRCGTANTSNRQARTHQQITSRHESNILITIKHGAMRVPTILLLLQESFLIIFNLYELYI